MKTLRTTLITSLATMFVLSACQNDTPMSSEDLVKNDYTVCWIKKFGIIDSEQDWKMATRITADVNPATFGQGYVVNIYNCNPKDGGVLIGQVSSLMTLDLDVAKDAESVYVRAYIPDLTAYMAAEYPIVNGMVDISVKSRAELPLSRADSKLTEPDGYQWILACEDLGSTDDYDFNDIVIGVNYVAGDSKKLTITPLAADGVLKAYVFYDSDKDGVMDDEEKFFEIHKALTGQDESTATGSYSMHNTSSWTNPGASVTKTLAVADDYSITNNMGDIKINVIKSNGDNNGTIISAPDHIGAAPQIICVKGDWEWPKERVSIEDAYPGFKNWSQNVTTTQWDANKAAGKYIDRITGTVTVSGVELGHEYVDLGLSVKWATCNIGANYPEDYGNYYAWGETETKSEYTEENSLWLKNWSK